MAISIRGDSPVQDALSGTATPTVVLTGAWQPQVDDVLLIIHGNNYYAFTNMDTPTVNGLTTGVNFIPEASVDAATNHAHIKSYWYRVTAAGDVTVAAPENGQADEEKVLTVYVLTGADTSAPIEDASVVSSTASVSPHTLPDNTTLDINRLLVVHDHSGAGASTASYTPPGAPYVEQYDTLLTFLSFTGGTEQLGSTVGSIGTRTITPATAVEFAAVAIVLKPATVGGGVVNTILVPARLNARAVAITPTPGAVSTILVPARLDARAVALAPTPVAPSVTLVPARMTARAVAVTPQPGLVSVNLVPARLNVRSRVVTPVPQPVSLTLVPARLTVRSVALGAVPGQVSVVSMTLVPARLNVRSRPLLAVPQPVATALVPARLNLRARTLSVQPGVVVVPLLPARLAVRAVPLVIPPVAIVQLVPAILRLVAVVIARPVATTPLPGGLNGEVIVVPLVGKASLAPTHDVASEALSVDTRAREL